jgi:hypothetical protein
MVHKSINQKESKDRNLANSIRKLSDEEIKVFLEVLSALMRGVPCPKDARKSYLKETENRLRNNGVDFLSKSRVFPTYGLKLLGRDTTGFPIKGFKRTENKNYPKLFAWYWAELERLSKLDKPNKRDFNRAQRVLVVLSFAKMIKLSSVNQIKKSLSDFETRVTDKKSNNSDVSDDSGPTDNKVNTEFEIQNSNKTVPSLIEILGIDVNLDCLPKYTDFDSISTKPSALRDEPQLPEWFAGQFMKLARTADGVKIYTPSGLKPPPYGKVSVITEAAGKLRTIVPYNTPFVHSTGLFARCRAILSKLDGDCSTNQAKGHDFIKKVTSPDFSGNSVSIVSVDLDAFSDNTSTTGICFGLSEMGLNGLDDYLLNLPVTLPNGKIITPKRLLMGLKGCFEMSTVLHHYAVKYANITSYALCGDDLVFTGSIEPYLASIENFGWSHNRSKTVISNTAAVFCGEYYWFGTRVSPRVPKVHTVYSNGKLRKASVIFSTVRDTVASLNTIYSRKVVAKIIGPFLRLLRRKWSGVIVPSLPSKLRGLGMKPKKPIKLLKLMGNKSILRICLMSIGVEDQLVSKNRWFGLPIEITPSLIQVELPDFPSLLKKGAVSLRPPEPSRAMVKDVTSLTLYQALGWYYFDERLDRRLFEPS